MAMKTFLFVPVCALLFTQYTHSCIHETRRPRQNESHLDPAILISEITPSSKLPFFGPYPPVRRNESSVETIHGHSVADPYRWLEDPDSAETKAFVEAQNNLTRPYLDRCPIRAKYEQRLRELLNYPKYEVPVRRGDSYFYWHNSGLQDQSVLFAQDDLADGEEAARVFVDPNELSEDGTVAIAGHSFSKDGTRYAYGLSRSGSDWVEIKFKDVKTGYDYEDVLEHVKYTSMSWTHDNRGIFYNRFPTSTDGRATTSNLRPKLYYHYLGMPQESDILIAEFPDHPEWVVHARVSDCGNYVVMKINRSTDNVNKLYYADLRELGEKGIESKFAYKVLVDDFDASYDYVTNNGSSFVFVTNLRAPNYKLITVDLAAHPNYETKELVPESPTDVLETAIFAAKDKLVLTYSIDVKAALFVHDFATGRRLRRIPMDIGSISTISGNEEDDDVFFSLSSFLTPPIVYRVNVTDESASPRVFRRNDPENFDASQFESKQIFYLSKDGTRIPMFLVHRKGLTLDGSAPAVLYGYGGFWVSLGPYFSSSRAIFIRHFGGVFAVANIRGGGEYGETWHEAGKLLNKQNVFDDFQAAAEYLIRQKYTSSSKLIIEGGSNGGLLVAACCNQRPDLFRCGVAKVGVMDMLRFHKFTVGHYWIDEYGDPDTKDHFENLLDYSPLHNVPDDGKNDTTTTTTNTTTTNTTTTQYPAMLLLTADHDDRVVPLHSYKLISELQYKIGSRPTQENPLMIRIEAKAGHGSGKPMSKVIEELVDIASFLYGAVGLTWTD